MPFSASYPPFGDFSKYLRRLKTSTLALLNPHHSFLPPSILVMQHQNSLSSIDEVTANDKNDHSRLPSYRETRRYRFHPYSRPIVVFVNEEDRLLVGFLTFLLLPCLYWLYRYAEHDLRWWMRRIECSSSLTCLSRYCGWVHPFFIAICYSCHTLIAPTSAPSYRRVRRASPPKYGTLHCIRITCSTPFRSYCGLSFFPLSSPTIFSWSSC